jgi:hypothetical protein
LNVDRSSALLVRVWLEGDADQFRARVISAGEDAADAGGDRTIAVVSSPAEVLAAVHRWLDDFTGHQPGTE